MAGPRLTGPRLLRQVATVQRRISASSTPSAFRIVPQTGSSKARLFTTSRPTKASHDSSSIDFAYLPTFALPQLPHQTENEAPSYQIPILPSATHRYDASDVMPHELTELRSRRDAEVASHEPEIDISTPQPVIVMAAHESTHISTPSAMSDVNDGAEHHATNYHTTDFFNANSSNSNTESSSNAKEILSSTQEKVEETLGSSVEAVRDAARMVAMGLEREGEGMRHSKGLLKQIWTGLVQDLTGPAGSKGVAGKS